MTDPHPDPLLTRQEAARHLNMAVRTFTKLVAADGPEAIWLTPDLPRWRRSELDTWANGRKGKKGRGTHNN
jgi:predicted DNA-binding transcriptional regulator AlpA